MPRIAGLTPFTKADSPEKDSALDTNSGWHSEGEEEFASRPPGEQIKRRLSGVEHPQQAKKPVWQNLTVSRPNSTTRHSRNRGLDSSVSDDRKPYFA